MAKRLRGAAEPLRVGPAVQFLPLRIMEDHAFAAELSRLALSASVPNPFFEPFFLAPSARHLAPLAQTYLAAVFDGPSLLGCLPLTTARDYYGYPVPHRSAWLHDNAFCGAPLVKAGAETDFWHALFAGLDKTAGASLFLHLPELPEASNLDQALVAHLAATGRPNSIAERGERAMLASSITRDDYLAQAMSSKKRKELRRQRKRLSELGELRTERFCDAECIDGWIEHFLALERAGWKGKAGSALACSDETRRFFVETMVAAAHEGRLERLSLILNGEPIAMLATFITPPGAYSFKTTFDERFDRYSPGLLLQLENLALLDHPQIEWTDSCAVEGHSMIERVWRQKRTIVSRNIAIGGAMRRAAFRALKAFENREWRGS